MCGGLFSFCFLTITVLWKRMVAITHNVFGLGEGGLVGCSNLSGCVCPLLPNPCYKLFVLFFLSVGKSLNH